MTILLYKDGKLIVDDEQPLEGVSLENLAAILSGASDGDVIQYDATNGMWVNKSAPSSLPEVTASDKGKYLKANESTGDPEWAADGSDLPDDPAQDGTYNLQNTVSSGTGTLSWASGGSSGGGVLVVNVTTSGNTMTLDKTWQEIHDSSVPVFGIMRTDAGVGWAFCADSFEDEGDFVVTCVFGTLSRDFTAASASGYPAYSGE